MGAEFVRYWIGLMTDGYRHSEGFARSEARRVGHVDIYSSHPYDIGVANLYSVHDHVLWMSVYSDSVLGICMIHVML